MRNNEKMNIMELYNEVKERENKIERTYYHEIIELINNTDLYKKGFTIDSDGNITIICQDWDEWEDEEMIVAIGFSGGILAYVELQGKKFPFLFLFFCEKLLDSAEALWYNGSETINTFTQ